MTPPAGRPREFCIEQALDAAMTAFWDHGYEGTSMTHLMAAMDLQKGSIYKAFGDKHSLFLQALERYLDRALEQTRSSLDDDGDCDGSSRDALRSWLDCAIVSGCNCPEKRGCFAINTVVELGPHDESAAALLRRHAAGVEKEIAGAIKRGQERGEFRRDLAAAELADAFYVFISGMAAVSKCGTSKARTKRLADFAVVMLT